MGAATLQPPKSGRSRFSKALPAPPSLPSFEFESQLDLSPLAPEKALPRLQPEAPLPPIPPPKGPESDRDSPGDAREAAMATTAKPLNYALPPLPSKFARPAPMSIPRRPVASPVTPIPALTPTSAPALAPPDPSPSPVGSFSSLLSAYSYGSAESPPSSVTTSAKDTTIPKNPYPVVSPDGDAQRNSAKPGTRPHDLPPLPSGRDAQRHESGGLQMLEARQERLPPPPPLKDAPRPQIPTGLQTPTTQAPPRMLAGPSLGNPSPPQERLWRRRSRSLKNLAVPDLKLASSHGSTASSAQNSALSGPTSDLHPQSVPVPPRSNPEASEPATSTRTLPPRSTNGGLPGRNIRPVIPSEQAAAPREAGMGQEASRILQRLGAVSRHESAEEQKARSQEAQVARAAAALSHGASVSAAPLLSDPRPPTPEYGAHDAKSRPPATVASPLSPASSPELPGEPKPTITRKAIGSPDAQLRHATSSLNLAPEPSNPGLGVRSSAGLPSSPAPGRNRGPGQAQLTGRISPEDGEGQRPVNAAPRQTPPPPAVPPSLNQGDAWTQKLTSRESKPISETGSIDTVKPATAAALQPLPAVQRPNPSPPQPDINHLPPVKEPDRSQPDTTDNPGAALFPRNWYTPRPADEVPDARPLTDRHFRCLTAHRYMTANRQRTNPIACRTCAHRDRNAECYICSACYLNVCSGCAGLLRRFKGDLRAVLAVVEEKKSGGGVFGGG